jgi:hypothetical protein
MKITPASSLSIYLGIVASSQTLMKSLLWRDGRRVLAGLIPGWITYDFEEKQP